MCSAQEWVSDWHNNPQHNTWRPETSHEGGPFEVPAMADAYAGIPNPGRNTYYSYLNWRQRITHYAKRIYHYWWDDTIRIS